MTDTELIDQILIREGWNGPSFLDAGDRGGRTSWGISERAHPEAWRHGPPSKELARAIYAAQYVAPWAWVPDEALRGLLADWTVTSGLRAATRGLQDAVDATVDGIVGPETRRLVLAAVNAGRPVHADVLRASAEHYMAIALDEPMLKTLMAAGKPLQLRFLRGWLRRVLQHL